MTAHEHWSTPYIGETFPVHPSFGGPPCWRLFRRIYRTHRGIDLPTYRGAPDPAEAAEVGALIAGEVASWWERVTDPQPFDGILFRSGEWPSHVGVVVRPDLMLHVARDGVAKLERYDRQPWPSRLVGVYRFRVAP